jgi:hypothetical protein
MFLIWFFIAWFIGIFAGAFFLIQPLIVLLFGIPFTLRLRRLGIMRGRGPLIEYMLSLVFLPLLLWGATAGMNAWIPDHIVAYWIGVGIAVLLGIGKCGANSANMQDYLRSNASAIDTDALLRHFPNLKSL